MMMKNRTKVIHRRSEYRLLLTTITALSAGTCGLLADQEVFTPNHVAKLRSVTSAKMSPDGKHIAYVLRVQRRPYEDESGPAWAELHVVDTAEGNSRPYVTGEVDVGGVDWTPDGREISFLAKRGEDEHKCLYAIPIDGGEARQVLCNDTGITSYSWSPDGGRVAFLAKEKKPEERKKLQDKGFNQEVYEEDWQAVRVWTAVRDDQEAEPEAMELEGSAAALRWSPAGGRLVMTLAPTSLVDDSLIGRTIRVVEVETGEVVGRPSTSGKLGQIVWSPDGSHLAIIAGQDKHDPREGRLMIATAAGGVVNELLPDYQGHVRAIAWQDDRTVMFVGHEGVYSTFGGVKLDGSERETIALPGGPVLRGLSLARDGRSAAFVADSPRHPGEVYCMKHGDEQPRRLTDSNPWLSDMRFAPQGVVTYTARDGLELEGILVRPLDEQEGKRYPLILSVHGGPESHISNGWVTAYSRPGQVGAARGFAVFYPNYRGSTGRGVAFSKMGQADYGGKEFDDLVDAVDHLVSMGLVDRSKVGITGGSYGGFASAWGATKLTKHFAASVMFVGISDQISKFGTTDIPHEMNLVHARSWPWEKWDWYRERSPLFYAEQSRTPILIMHGKDDPRVHPSQSMALYRYLKTLGKTPVRLVLYPGEGHGNRKAAARLDYSLRQMRWMGHYLKGPGGAPPPYELDYGFEDAEEEEDSSGE